MVISKCNDQKTQMHSSDKLQLIKNKRWRKRGKNNNNKNKNKMYRTTIRDEKQSFDENIFVT